MERIRACLKPFMTGNANSSPNSLEYFRALRTEIIEAQKLRVQVGLAKTVFLGTLLGFFFGKDVKGDPAILVCPFIAFMFDCMVYGLSFNIRDVEGYIAQHIEDGIDPNARYQRFRVERERKGFKDCGRIMFRTGSYGLSVCIAAISFYEASPAHGTLSRHRLNAH